MRAEARIAGGGETCALGEGHLVGAYAWLVPNPIVGNSSVFAYSQRAQDYINLLGSMGAVHPLDQQLVATWADSVEGEVIDAGCGPGHWTDFLSERGVTARGIDQVPKFVENARSMYPGRAFQVGTLENLDASTCSVGGVLAWYSLIHHEPDEIHLPLDEFYRVLRPGGELLVGFFEGASVEKFAHAVLPAYRWPINVLSEKLRTAGFDVIETHARSTVGQRPHGAISARRSGHP